MIFATPQSPPRGRRWVHTALLALVGATGVACSAADPPSRAPDGGFAKGFAAPEDCSGCHPTHFAQWRISNHAYALADPVFRAMVELGQKDTEGELGNFCVECHAPIATRTGQSEVTVDADGAYQQPLTGLGPEARHGITCDVCHTLTGLGGVSTNADFELTPDGTRRALISDPAPNEFHASERDRTFADADMCAPCHNVFSEFFREPVQLEATFSEWRVSKFNGNQTCQDCHMPASRGPAARGGQEREIHDHTMVGVDVSLLPPKEFPGYTELREATEKLLQGAAEWQAEWRPTGKRLIFHIQNLAGHALPSGATADREMWIELRVRSDDGKRAFESGVRDARGDLKVADPAYTLEPGADPQLSVFRQKMRFDPALEGLDGEPRDVHFLWQPNAVDEFLIGAGGERSVSYDLSALAPGRYEVRARLLFRSFPPYLLRDLVERGLLDPEVPSRVPTVEMESLSLSIRVP